VAGASKTTAAAAARRVRRGGEGKFIAGFGRLGFRVAEIRAGAIDLISWPFSGWWDRVGDP
jgi:hypothetical protein